jgi:hypothetical protein
MLVYKQRPITGNHGWRTCCFFVFGSDMNLELCQPASTRDKTQFFLSLFVKWMRNWLVSLLNLSFFLLSMLASLTVIIIHPTKGLIQFKLN